MSLNSRAAAAIVLTALVGGQAASAEKVPLAAAFQGVLRGLQEFNPDGSSRREAASFSLPEAPQTPPGETTPAEFKGLTGRLVTPDSPDWDVARRGFNSLFDPHPRAIIFCQSVPDVVHAVNWVRRTRTPFRIRSGRHSYEGYSSVDGGLVVDVSGLDSFQFDDATKTATIGPGMQALEFQEKLWERGVAVPAATAPTVGMAGLTLGGGFGILTRKYGTTADNLVSVEMVTASGRVIRASAAEHADLFRALRGGGGGNFGVAVSFTYRTHPISDVAFAMLSWDWSQFDAVVPAFLRWAVAAPNAITPFLRLSADRKITLFAQYTPDRDLDVSAAEELLAPMVRAAPPLNPGPNYFQAAPFIDVVHLLAKVAEDVDTSTGQQMFKSASSYVMRPLPPEAVAVIKQRIESAPAVHGVQPAMIQLLGGGGAAADVAPGSTAMFYRGALFVAQYDVYMSAGEEQTAIGWVEDFRDAMSPYTEGAYVNYHDGSLKDPLRAYYGDNLEWLVKVKRKYDRHNLFNFPQSIPVKLP